ncbi:MAG: porin family protein [Acidobacteriia bacterium]|nr:porin family protein [Terriglobia bacterium]
MFRFLGLVISLLLVFSLIAVGQDNPKAEIFGGYQYTRVNPGHGVDSLNLNGWNASVSGYFTKYLGISGDFSGAYGTPFGVSTKLHTFMFGPIVHFPNSSKITPFAHALFGGAHLNASAFELSGAQTKFAWAAGGGLDANLNSRFAVRLAQVDFLQTRFVDLTQNNFRYSAGIVIKF